MKKLSAPGRKGSVKKTAFKGDDLVDGVNTAFEEKQKEKEIEEKAAALSIQAEKDQATEAEQQAKDAATAAAAAERARQEAEEKAAAVAEEQRLEKQKEEAAAFEKTNREEEEARIRAKKQEQHQQQQKQLEKASREQAEREREREELRAKEEQNKKDREEEEKEQAAAAASAAAERKAVAARAALEEKERRQKEEEEEERARAEREAAELQAAIEQQKAELKKKQEQDAREAAEVEAREKEELEKQARARQEQARLAVNALSEKEQAELAEKQRKAEEKRRKRAMFLNDMDSFSTDFQTKSAEAEEARKRAEREQEERLVGQMKAKSGQYVAPVAASKLGGGASAEEEERTATALRAQQEEEARLAARADAAWLQQQQQQQQDESNIPPPAVATASDPAKFNNLANSLFSGDNSELPAPALATSTANEDSSFLRMPSRIGSKATTKSGVGSSKPAPVAEEDEEEGTGGIDSISNILTLEERRTMTTAQKEKWKVKQGDLSQRRKDFHGVVTLAFDGIFSWQMYGSADAVDESGNPYTEYLMRCQWGTTFENMQPWIVAHRYKEFDTLDGQIRRMFPLLQHNMPSMPEKDFFNYLNSSVIAKRRQGLEDYVSKIVISMPTILRSELFNSFLGINERLVVIKKKLTDMGLMSTTAGADLSFITVQTENVVAAGAGGRGNAISETGNSDGGSGSGGAQQKRASFKTTGDTLDPLSGADLSTRGGREKGRWATTGDEELGTSAADGSTRQEKGELVSGGRVCKQVNNICIRILLGANKVQHVKVYEI